MNSDDKYLQRSRSRSRSRSPSPYRSSRRRSYSPRRDPRDYYHRDPRDSYYSRDPRDYYERDHRGGGRYEQYPPYDRGGYDSYRRRSPPPARPRYEIIKGDESERSKSLCLYVGNVPYHFREISEMFEKFGKITSISVPQDRVTGRNKGFAFVSFEDRLDAEDAKKKYDSHTVDGRRLRIDWDIGRDKKEVVKQTRFGGSDHREPREPRDREMRERDPRERDYSQKPEHYGEPSDRDPRGDRGDPRAERGDPRGDRGDPRGDRGERERGGY
ncbi:hypothetical protein BC833DRAFT_619165 [Globomyces pollinis-pini]|nr:hypothetical protein BC833DRAFT_619165 [Globomyces pollinis-pini]